MRRNRKTIRASVVILVFLTALSMAILPAKLPKNSTMTLSNNTVYVAGDGSGDFNCHRSNNRQDQ